MPSQTNMCAVWIATALSLLLRAAVVEAGITKGFQKEVPSLEDVLPSFERTTRQLLTEDETEGISTGPRGGVRDASPKIQPTEISFMIVGRKCLESSTMLPF